MTLTSKQIANHLRQFGVGSTAVVLGAGASALFGFPTTGQLLPYILSSLDNEYFLAALRGEKRGVGPLNRKQLSGFLSQLLPGHTGRDTKLPLPLVTSVLSLLDYSLATNQSVMPGRVIEEVRQARRLLERAILEAINDARMLEPVEKAWLNVFSEFLADLRDLSSVGSLAVVTTNYDMAVDRAIFSCAEIDQDRDGEWDVSQIAEKIDFGFQWSAPADADAADVRDAVPRLRSPMFRLLKLHGSTNWLRCPLCDRVYVNPRGPIWRQAYRAVGDDLNRCPCSKTRLQAQIVSPSFVRDIREPNLASLWNQALESLRSAERWILMGYSFPDEDLGVRALLTRAFGARRRLPSVYVIQRGSSAAYRYNAFFPSDSLYYSRGGLEAFLNAW